jgi:hypothetical protein
MNEITCKFKFQCPKKWEELKRTESKDIKFCDHCSQNVYFAESQSQFEKIAAEGKCVAIKIEKYMMLGEPEPMPSFEDIGK